MEEPTLISHFAPSPDVDQEYGVLKKSTAGLAKYAISRIRMDKAQFQDTIQELLHQIQE